MNSKIFIFAALAMALAVAGFVIVEDSPESDAANYTVSFAVSPSGAGTVSHASVTAPGGASISTSGTSLLMGLGSWNFTNTATANTGYTFSSWSYSGSTVTGDMTITAVFTADAPTTYTVSFSKSPSAGGSLSSSSLTVPAGASYSASGTSITFTKGSYSGTVSATAASGYSFDHWSSTSGTVNSSMSITAYFSYSPPPTPTTYTVSFSKSPSAGGSLSYSSLTVPDGASYSASGTSITFTKGSYSGTVSATAASGYSFDHWSSTSGTVNSSMTITAYFSENPTYTVTFAVSPSGAGTLSYASVTAPSGASISTSGTSLIMGLGSWNFTNTVTANPGYTFDSWSYSGSTVTGNMTITAVFTGSGVGHTVILAASPSDTGTFSPYDVIANVPDGAMISTSDDAVILTLGSWNFTAHAVPEEGYSFSSWSYSGSTVTSDMTITAVFVQGVNVDLSLIVVSGGSAEVQDIISGTTTGEVVGPSSDTLTVLSRHTITASATADDGNTFVGWINFYTMEVYSTDNPWTFRAPNEDFEFVAYFQADVTVTIAAGTGGSVSEDSITVPYGSIPATDDNILTIGTYSVTAWPNLGYSFDSWTNAIDPITSARTITANFEPTPVTGTYWSNGTVADPTYNGRIDVLFDFPRSSTTHVMDMDIFSMSANPDMSVNWTPSGYSLSVSIEYDTTLHVSATLLGGSSPITGTVSPGAWQRILISIDPEHGTVTATPVRTFTSFTQYTLYTDQVRTVIDYGGMIKDAGIRDILHTEDGEGDSPRFSVVSTRVFLDTYGVVMFGPEINVADYFPQYDALRLNIYSFALYGDSIRLNGQEWAVQDGKITVRYVRDQDGNHVPTYDPDLPVQTRTFALNNIYVTWDGSRCSLTFVDDRFTLDLGTYQPGNLTVSFTGMWYFTTMLWDSSIGTEKAVTGWKALPETTSQQMILIFMGILLLAGVAAMIHVRRSGRGTVDLIVIGAAMVVAFIMLGMWYRWLVSQTSRT